MGGCCIGDCGFCCIADCGFCCIFDLGCNDYRPTANKTVDDAKKIADEIEGYKERLSEKARKDESDIVQSVMKGIDSIVEEIKEFNEREFSGKKLDINIHRIERLRKRLNDDIVGFIVDSLSDRLTLSDPEFAAIHKESDEKKREKRFNEFSRRIIDKAIDAMCDKVSETVEAQQKIISDDIEERLKEVHETLDTSQKELESIMNERMSDGANLEHKEVHYMYEHAICSMILDELACDKSA